MQNPVPQSIKFQRYYVTNGAVKARVWYSLDNNVSGRPVVTIYAKDYDRKLGVIIPSGYENDTDYQSDYFDKGRVRLFEDHPLYSAARARAEQIRDERAQKVTA
jgi:hypothetical protein